MREITKIRLAITYYCELNCKHCYVPQQLRDGYLDIMKNELTIEKIKKFINYLIVDYGLKKVDITGGETLLTKVWPRTKEIVGFALSNGLEVQINTTGSGNISPYMIKEAFAENLGNLLLHVSLDGVDEQYVDAFRGKKGVFTASIQFMEEAVALGFRVRTRLTMTPANVKQVIPCYSLVSDLGVQSFMCKPVNVVGNSRKNKLNTLNKETLRRIQLQLLDKSKGNTTTLHLPAPLEIGSDDIDDDANVEIFRCLCGQHLIYIAYNGDVFPCTYMAGMDASSKYVIGNIKDHDFDFKSVWEKDDTFKEFRSSAKHVCTAHQLSLERTCV